MGRVHRPWWPPLVWGIGTQPGQDSSVVPYPPMLVPLDRVLKRGLHHLIRAETLSIVESE